jgi:hypothetical protein
MYGSRGCTGHPGALDCQNCILPVIHRWKALVTAELMVILHLNMAYYKENHLL